MKYLFVLAIFGLVGCSTTVPMKDLSETETLDQGAILPFDFVDQETLSSGKCEINVRNLDTRKSYDFEYRVGQDAVVIRLPVGTYFLDEMYCGNKGVTRMSHRVNPFVIVPGKLTVIPPFRIVRERDVDYWDQSETAVTEGISKLDILLPKETKKRLVKPRDGQPFSFAEGLKKIER